MSERFFVETPVTGDRARLAAAEAQHVVKVMRVKIGDEIVVFDGSGAEFTARIAGLGRQEVELVILERREVSREAARELTLAVALPKGDRQQWLVEKATELGVARLAPLIAERSVAQPTENTLARLRRGVIEAAKQCGRNKLLEIAEPQAWSAFAAHDLGDALRLFAHPEGQAIADIENIARSIIVVIGPEGGWSDAEVALADQHAWQRVSLGPRILRVETAALALAAKLLY